ncbi:MAG: GDP-mannose 4,6-dehydratase [Planctomycetota bacterium]|nr:GDP-mannose 4,6-dehydratase [Planctomycetota bacterium]
MKYFITGGAGFIGSHLADKLINGGEQVIVLDDLSTGSMQNIDHLIGQPGFDYRIGSALDEPLVVELVDRADVTVHLAAAVGVRLIIERPTHTIHTNVASTHAVLEAAARKQKRVIVASTSEVYGKSSKVPFGEEDDLGLGPTSRSRWAYACSKALDEWLSLAYHAEKNVPVTVARFFNVVGPRQTGRYGMVLPNFARQALENEPITVYGDGEQSRCFGHVKDAVEAIHRLIHAEASIGLVVNVGNDEEVTIFQLAEKVRELAGSSSEIVLVPYEKAYSKGFEDMPRRVPDVTRLVSLTGFRPSIPLEQTIRDVLDDQRAILAAAS